MKYLSLFTGIGGFELGINQAYESLCNAHGSEKRGVKADTPRDKGQGLFSEEGQDTGAKKRPARECPSDRTHERPLCVGYSEIDKYASSIYEKHFPEHKNYGDITGIDEKSLPDFDLLVGGFPCQSFSIAGKRQGFKDTRGTLFFHIERIVRAKKPRLLLLENVKGLLSHDEGNTFRTIISTLTDVGYDLQWQVLNSKDYGVPQNRERVFIVGHLRGTARPQVFPFGITDEENPEPDTKRSGEHTQTISTQGGLNARGSFVDVAYTLDANYYKGTNTIEKSRRQLIRSEQRIRRLTPTECERLQGFPDGWTRWGYSEDEQGNKCLDPVSDTQRYKTLGNAVTVNVIQAIMEKIL